MTFAGVPACTVVPTIEMATASGSAKRMFLRMSLILSEVAMVAHTAPARTDRGQLIEGIGSDPATGSGSVEPSSPVLRTPRLSTNHTRAHTSATPPRIVTVSGAPI
jgi:hypothetical protein